MPTSASAAVEGGFKNPVFDAQTAFRRIMGAFAEPGTIAGLGGLATGTPGLAPATAVLLATLADADTLVFLEAEGAEVAARWIAFQTGAPVVGDPAGAVFAVLAAGSDPSGWSRLPAGTETYPDRSATLILPVEGLRDGAPLRLAGPGIETVRIVAPRGLPEGFLAARAANAALFPRGHDLLLVAGDEVMALPRTTRIEEADPCMSR